MTARASGTSVHKPPAAVSTNSARRFTAKVRARRRRRFTLGVAVLLVVLTSGWALLASPWATVRQIVVVGAQRTPVGDVRAAAAEELGQPLLGVDVTAIAARVLRLPLVAGVQVRRAWPSHLRIEIVERQVVAAVPAARGVKLVDRDGVVVDVATHAPAKFPLVHVDLAVAGPTALRAALDVLAGLPDAQRSELRSLGADGADEVWFTLTDGSRVMWGSSTQGPDKVVALAALRRLQPARPARSSTSASNSPSNSPSNSAVSSVVYDVSAPADPAVRPNS